MHFNCLILLCHILFPHVGVIYKYISPTVLIGCSCFHPELWFQWASVVELVVRGTVTGSRVERRWHVHDVSASTLRGRESDIVSFFPFIFVQLSRRCASHYHAFIPIFKLVDRSGGIPLTPGTNVTGIGNKVEWVKILISLRFFEIWCWPLETSARYQ